jgi:hypothetical protein
VKLLSNYNSTENIEQRKEERKIWVRQTTYFYYLFWPALTGLADLSDPSELFLFLLLVLALVKANAVPISQKPING